MPTFGAIFFIVLVGVALLALWSLLHPSENNYVPTNTSSTPNSGRELINVAANL